MREFRGEESRASGSAGYGGVYVLAGGESRGKAAVAGRVVMPGRGAVVVRVEGFGVEATSEAVRAILSRSRLKVCVDGAGHVVGDGGSIGGGVMYRAILGMEGIPT